MGCELHVTSLEMRTRMGMSSRRMGISRMRSISLALTILGVHRATPFRSIRSRMKVAQMQEEQSNVVRKFW